MKATLPSDTKQIASGEFLLATRTLEAALDDIQRSADQEALAWIRDPTSGRLSVEACCDACDYSVRGVQDEARDRLRTHYSPDDPLKKDRIDDLGALDESELDWISKSDAATLYGVTMSVIGYRIETQKVRSVLAPKSRDSDLPVRYVPRGDLQDTLGPAPR